MWSALRPIRAGSRELARLRCSSRARAVRVVPVGTGRAGVPRDVLPLGPASVLLGVLPGQSQKAWGGMQDGEDVPAGHVHFSRDLSRPALLLVCRWG